MNEIWKDAKGYEDYFQVSNLGRIFSKRTNKILKLNSSSGYLSFTTRFNGRKSISKCLKVHRLVALTFIENPDNKPDVNHIDGNKLNNHVSNLEWVTESENMLHASQTGLTPYEKITGEKNGSAKITWEIARKIRKMKSDNSKLSGKKISVILNISSDIVKSVLSNKTWKE